jgi:hypothetical protein
MFQVFTNISTSDNDESRDRCLEKVARTHRISSAADVNKSPSTVAKRQSSFFLAKENLLVNSTHLVITKYSYFFKTIFNFYFLTGKI